MLIKNVFVFRVYEAKSVMKRKSVQLELYLFYVLAIQVCFAEEVTKSAKRSVKVLIKDFYEGK